MCKSLILQIGPLTKQANYQGGCSRYLPSSGVEGSQSLTFDFWNITFKCSFINIPPLTEPTLKNISLGSP